MNTISRVAFCVCCIPAGVFIGHLASRLVKDWQKRGEAKALVLALGEFAVMAALLVEIVWVAMFQ